MGQCGHLSGQAEVVADAPLGPMPMTE